MDSYMYICIKQPIIDYVLGVFLCIGGIVSYFPQYYTLIKTKDHKGLSEISLLLLNIGSACLSANSLILNWYRFECYQNCNFWLCTANMLSMIQIVIGWVVVFPLYLIFVRYKIKNKDHKTLYDLIYIFIYIVFILIMIIVGLSEKAYSEDSHRFFMISAKVLGVLASLCFCVVWIPQIIKLFKTMNQGNLSLWMFILQTPGNVIIIIFQILYHQNWSTWMTYIITLVEQLIILVLLLIIKKRNLNTINRSIVIDSSLYLTDSNDDFLDDLDDEFVFNCPDPIII